MLIGLSAVTAKAATGDLVVVCYNSDGGDDFALLALPSIPGGTRYFITDSGWSTNSNTLVSEGNAPSTNRQIQFDVAAGAFLLERSSGSTRPVPMSRCLIPPWAR